MGQQQPVRLVAGTVAARLYGVDAATEPYYCNYGVNADYLKRLQDGGLCVSGLGDEGEVRIVELPGHPFFMATLFLPQARSTRANPHPVLLGFAAALGGRC